MLYFLIELINISDFTFTHFMIYGEDGNMSYNILIIIFFLYFGVTVTLCTGVICINI